MGQLHGVTIVLGVENCALQELLTEDWFCGVLMDEAHSCGDAEPTEEHFIVDSWMGRLHGVTIVPGAENCAPQELLTEDWFCGVLMDEGYSCGDAELELTADHFADSGYITLLHIVTELTGDA